MFVKTMSRSTNSGIVTTPSTPAIPCWTHRSLFPRPEVGRVDEAERGVDVADLLQGVLGDDQLDARHRRLQVVDRSGSQAGIKTLIRSRAGAVAAKVVAKAAAPVVPARNVRRFISGLILGGMEVWNEKSRLGAKVLSIRRRDPFVGFEGLPPARCRRATLGSLRQAPVDQPVAFVPCISQANFSEISRIHADRLFRALHAGTSLGGVVGRLGSSRPENAPFVTRTAARCGSGCNAPRGGAVFSAWMLLQEGRGGFVVKVLRDEFTTEGFGED